MIHRRKKNNKKYILMRWGFPIYLVFCLFTIVWMRAAVVNLEYELGELDRIKRDLMRERKMIVAQKASFYSSEKIEEVALKRLGMNLPERENVFFVSKTPVAGPYKASMK